MAGTHKPTSCRPYGALCIIVPPFTGVPACGLHPCLYSDVPSGDLRPPTILNFPKSGGRRTTGRGAAQRNPCTASTTRHGTPKGWQEHINRHPAAPTGLCVLLCRHLQGFRPAASTPACIPTSPPGTCACPCPCPRPAPQAGREGAGMETKKGRPFSGHPSKRLAATYFSTNKCSIIGDGGLNFSVRNGKR